MAQELLEKDLVIHHLTRPVDATDKGAFTHLILIIYNQGFY